METTPPLVKITDRVRPHQHLLLDRLRSRLAASVAHLTAARAHLSLGELPQAEYATMQARLTAEQAVSGLLELGELGARDHGPLAKAVGVSVVRIAHGQDLDVVLAYLVETDPRTD